MSMVAGLWKGVMDGEWHCWCPACGSEEDVDIDDEYQVLDDGNKEYYVHCCECGQGFYVSESYNEY